MGQKPFVCNPRPLAEPALDRSQASPLPRESMTHLNAIAATKTVHLWWRGYPLAARWRD
jgi:hypothetical protein